MRCEVLMKLHGTSHPLQMGQRIRRYFVLITTVTLVALVFFLSYSGDDIIAEPPRPVAVRWLVGNRGFILDTAGCRIPDWDPYDPSVLPFVSKVQGPYKCPGRPQFIRALPNAVIHIDHNLLGLYYGVQQSNVSCSYRPIVRDPGPQNDRTDNRYLFGAYRDLEFGIPLKDEFIVINCSLGDLPTFTQFIPLVPLKEGIEQVKSAREAATGSDLLNVIMVGIDSVSKLNFLRHFRKTRKFLESHLPQPFELKGYTKVADNTFPNLVPLLTGHFIERYWNESMRDMFFDDMDFVWKEYAIRGCRTLFAEDAPRIATFNYLKRGFRDPPADYYFRPFALAVEASSARRESRANCLQSVPEIEVVFDYLRGFVSTMGEGRRMFAFAFVARLTHDSLNAAGYADEPTFRLLRDLQGEGALNRSLLVLFSDHGIRFGPIRQTYIGKFEERMPFIFLSFPRWFLVQHPEFERNLRDNQDRLTTPFDVHATLVHLLNVSAGAPNPQEYGRSLLLPIAGNRTCEEAGILPHWCPCQTHKPVSVTEQVVANGASALVDTLNKLLEPHADVCAPLRLDRILDARSGQANDAVLRFVKHQNDVINRHVVLGQKVDAPSDYLLVVRTGPGGAVFEGTVRHDAYDNTYRVLDDISRLNVYGNQSSCIDSARLRKFCYCRPQNLFHKILRTVRNSSHT